jgi:DNA-binding MarR family transcriptional regulator
MNAKEHSVLIGMRLIEKISHTFLRNKLAPFGINRYEMSVLMALYKKDGISRRAILSESFGEETGIGLAIKTLDKKGYITRKRNPADNRAQMLYVAKGGLELKEDINRINEALENYLIRDLSRREQELFKKVMASLCYELRYDSFGTVKK